VCSPCNQLSKAQRTAQIGHLIEVSVHLGCVAASEAIWFPAFRDTVLVHLKSREANLLLTVQYFSFLHVYEKSPYLYLVFFATFCKLFLHLMCYTSTRNYARRAKRPEALILKT
jgi:hypothetical protein